MDKEEDLMEDEQHLDEPAAVEALSESVVASAEESDELEAGDGEPAEGQTQPFGRLELDLPLKTQVEALVFASAKPMMPADIVEIFQGTYTIPEVEEVLYELRDDYAKRNGGFTLEFLYGLGYQFQTIADTGPLMERLFASRPRPLSRAALETLAIVAYRQPATRAAIEFIRGVDSGSIIKNLMDRDMIRCVGRKEDAGRPMLFGTTEEFLRIFGIASLKDLPPLQSFQPDSETMSSALKELEKIDEVDVEQFVADQDTETPLVSAGLLSEEDQFVGEFLAEAPIEVEEKPSEASDT